MLKTFGLALAIGVFAISATAQDISRQIPVTEDFNDGELSWSGLPGGYVFRAKLIVVEGVVEFCGVGVYTNAQVRPTATHMLRGAELKLNGRVALRDFSFFNRVNRERQLAGATANCKSTGMPLPRGGVEVEDDWPNGTFRN
jgi:hypothetical protein